MKPSQRYAAAAMEERGRVRLGNMAQVDGRMWSSYGTAAGVALSRADLDKEWYEDAEPKSANAGEQGSGGCTTHRVRGAGDWESWGMTYEPMGRG